MSNAPPKLPNEGAGLPDGLLQEIIAAHVPGARLRAAHALSGGVSADVYRLDLVAADGAPRSVVLRVHGPRHNGHPAALEFDILQAVTGLGVAAPHALALDESLRFLPHPFLLLEHIDGETAFLTHAADQHAATMANVLAEIHALPITGLPALPSRKDPIPEVYDFLPKVTELEALRRALSEMGDTIYKGPCALLHGDFWPGNLVWRELQLVGILDWEDAAIGDPLSDVACTALELTYVAGTAGAEQFVRAYGRLRPIDPIRFALWQVYVAAAGHHAMGGWGLEASREARMRAAALGVIRRAGALLI